MHRGPLTLRVAVNLEEGRPHGRLGLEAWLVHHHSLFRLSYFLAALSFVFCKSNRKRGKGSNSKLEGRVASRLDLNTSAPSPGAVNAIDFVAFLSVRPFKYAMIKS